MSEAGWRTNLVSWTLATQGQYVDRISWLKRDDGRRQTVAACVHRWRQIRWNRTIVCVFTTIMCDTPVSRQQNKASTNDLRTVRTSLPQGRGGLWWLMVSCFDPGRDDVCYKCRWFCKNIFLRAHDVSVVKKSDLESSESSLVSQTLPSEQSHLLFMKPSDTAS